MNWKNRLKNYNFWISLFSAVLLILQALKIEFDIAYINEIFTAILGLLVVVGIISDPTRTTTKTNETSSQYSNQNSSLGAAAQNNGDQKIGENGETLPIEKESETDFVLNKNDFENVVMKLTQSLNDKIDKINHAATETNCETSKIVKSENCNESKLFEAVCEDVSREYDCLKNEQDCVADKEMSEEIEDDLIEQALIENNIQLIVESSGAENVVDDKISENQVKNENISSNVNASYLNIL